ncbi:MAG: AraC family transcriptional regulator [Lachnospiraceae bacterium]|nr:AraC family transcriptional regulator [Lachnospiraceae bacterium]
MYAIFQNKDEFDAQLKRAETVPPHLHRQLEIVYIMSGALEIGVGTEFYRLNRGDLALIFPDVIHHYQTNESDTGDILVINTDPSLVPAFKTLLQSYETPNPVVSSHAITLDTLQALHWLADLGHPPYEDVLQESYLQVILSRVLPKVELVKKKTNSENDLVYRTVDYIAKHYMEPISLTSIANALYVSPYSLSRLFSSTFHMNFNKYLNQTRLREFTHLIRMSNQSITEACMNAGFESQRTLNRVFQEEYHMSPSKYKKKMQRMQANITKPGPEEFEPVE